MDINQFKIGSKVAMLDPYYPSTAFWTGVIEILKNIDNKLGARIKWDHKINSNNDIYLTALYSLKE